MDDTQNSPQQDHDRSIETAESLRALRAQAEQTLADHRDRIGDIEGRLTTQLEFLAEELARERRADEQVTQQATALEELRNALEEKEAEVEEVLEELANQTLAFEAQIAERDEELGQLLELQDEEIDQHDTLAQELNETREALEQLRNQECSECHRVTQELSEAQQQLSQLHEQLGELQSEHEAKLAELEAARQAAEQSEQQQAEVAAQLAETQQLFESANQRADEAQQLVENATQRADEAEQEIEVANGRVEEAGQQAEEANRRAEEIGQQVEAANQRIEELTKLEGIDEELEQTRRKFELALADVHKLKRENAELHEELLSRPEADHQESPELVSLRSERDALAERLADLENAPEPSNDQDSQQELDDLQRRFELAVDDVRQLKAENAELKQKLESKPAGAPAPASDEPQDWQAQKARLMAALDAEDQGMVSEARREEIATIEGTISITDQVVAEKDALIAKRDAEIADLKKQLEERPEGQDLDQLRDEIAAEILGDDESVKAEVARLQEKQEELDSKLRQAELDISVQRATLAREQAALEEKIALLPTLEEVEEGSEGQKPKRRWLSALGLKDDGEN